MKHGAENKWGIDSKFGSDLRREGGPRLGAGDPQRPCVSTIEMSTFRVTFGLSYPGKKGGCQRVGFQCRFRQGGAGRQP